MGWLGSSVGGDRGMGCCSGLDRHGLPQCGSPGDVAASDHHRDRRPAGPQRPAAGVPHLGDGIIFGRPVVALIRGCPARRHHAAGWRGVSAGGGREVRSCWPPGSGRGSSSWPTSATTRSKRLGDVALATVVSFVIGYAGSPGAALHSTTTSCPSDLRIAWPAVVAVLCSPVPRAAARPGHHAGARCVREVRATALHCADVAEKRAVSARRRRRGCGQGAPVDP